MIDKIRQQISDSIEVKQAILGNPELLGQIEKLCQTAIEAYRSGKKVLIAGNGGSAADAQHIAAELVARFYFDRPGLPAIALTVDTSILTAVGNDYGYDYVFARQVEANGNHGDVFIGISTSGNSPNIMRALASAKEKGMVTVGLIGGTGGKMLSECDIPICVPSKDTPRIQESHIMIGHIACEVIERVLFAK